MSQKRILFWMRQLISLKHERLEEIKNTYGTTKWANGVSENILNEIEELEEIVRKENYLEEQKKQLQTKKQTK